MHWSVIHDRVVPLNWTYPAGADAAVLTIDNALGHRVLTRNFSAPETSFDWTVFEGETVAADDCFTLTLTFSDSSVETTSLALLRGAFGPTEIRDVNPAKWKQARGRHAVVPYGSPLLDGATDDPRLTVMNRKKAVTVGERTGRAGWFGWRGRGGEVFDLTLAASGAESLSAEILFLTTGLAIKIK